MQFRPLSAGVRHADLPQHAANIHVSQSKNTGVCVEFLWESAESVDAAPVGDTDTTQCLDNTMECGTIY